MLALKIKQTEIALADGRLDEACELLTQSDVRTHRRGQSLIMEATKRLRQRMDAHLQQQQFEAALRDCQRALSLAGNQPDLEQFRQQAAAQLAEQQQQQAQERELLQVARQRLSEGELTLGQQLCAELPESTPQRAELSAEIQHRRQAADVAVSRAEEAWQRKAFHEAVEALRQAQQLAPHHGSLPLLRTKILQSLCDEAQSALVQGQLPYAETIAALAGSIDPQAMEVRETVMWLQHCQRAAQQIGAGDFAAAWETLQVLSKLLPAADWIPPMLDWARQARDSHQALRGSPLFALRESPFCKVTENADRPFRAAHAGHPAVAALLPDRFLLQIDGAGRYLVLCSPTIRLGSAGAPARTDVDWSGTSLSDGLEIERMEGDYFLRSSQPVRINGKPVTSALLAHEDRLLIGARGAVKFLLPCAASRSAMLQFSGLRLHPPDLRGVILMDEAIVIAPNHQAHVRLRELQQGYVFFHRQQQLFLRPMSSPEGQASLREIRIAHPVSLGSAQLVVLPVTD